MGRFVPEYTPRQAGAGAGVGAGVCAGVGSSARTFLHHGVADVGSIH